MEKESVFKNIVTKILASSADPEKLSMSVTGVIIMLTSMLMPHAQVTADETHRVVLEVINAVKNTTFVIGEAVSALGVIRKAFYEVKDFLKHLFA